MALFLCKVEKGYHKSAVLALYLRNFETENCEARGHVTIWGTLCWYWIRFMTPFFRPDK